VIFIGFLRGYAGFSPQSAQICFDRWLAVPPPIRKQAQAEGYTEGFQQDHAGAA
jgi:hypothetical protein